jgi:hypothetical protein
MNTATDEISAETVAHIRERAMDMGLSAEDYLSSILPTATMESKMALKSNWNDFKADMEDLGEDIVESGSYNGTYSRGDIYSDDD